jgi:hypothetical protein
VREVNEANSAPRSDVLLLLASLGLFVVFGVGPHLAVALLGPWAGCAAALVAGGLWIRFGPGYRTLLGGTLGVAVVGSCGIAFVVGVVRLFS